MPYLQPHLLVHSQIIVIDQPHMVHIIHIRHDMRCGALEFLGSLPLLRNQTITDSKCAQRGIKRQMPIRLP